jgi:hypothetical protein
LYGEIEQELRRREVKEILVADSSLCLGLDLRYQAAATMLLRRVYAPTDFAYDMTLDSDRPVPEPQSVAGFSFRDLNEADAEVLSALCATEFPGMTGVLKFLCAGEPCGVVGAFSAEGNLAAFAGTKSSFIIRSVRMITASKRQNLDQETRREKCSPHGGEWFRRKIRAGPKPSKTGLA